MRFYSMTVEETLAALNSAAEGLSSVEAERRLIEGGKNRLAEAKRPGLARRFLIQLLDPMTLVLLAAAVLAGISAAYAGEPMADLFIILAVVILNASLGVLQESKAERAIDALRDMTAAVSRVLRGGKPTLVRSEDLAVGDVLLLEAGDAVPADARILEAASLKTEEAALTGESVPVNKDASAMPDGEVSLGDRRNMLYMGSSIAYGRGRAIVTHTGMHTEMGRIASALNYTAQEKTPLQRKLSELSRILTYLVLGISALVFAAGLLRGGQSWLDSFMLAVSLAVAAIPEGLSAVVTIQLSMGVTRMARESAVIRRLSAVETLGCTEVICSDKTGTLTQNRMSVAAVYAPDEAFLAAAMALCSDAEPGPDGRAVGEPTECALVDFAGKMGLGKGLLSEEQPRMAEAPFDAARKMMSTIHARGSAFIQYTKGAPDELLSRCLYRLSEGGKRLPMTEEGRREILEKNRTMAGRALRVLACAYREYEALPSNIAPESLERELTFIGLSGMIDPVRPEAKAAVERCRRAGIRVVMITGDHRDTAVAIAGELGILAPGQESSAITGGELNRMTQEELCRRVENTSVYARVQPEHKTRIVAAWQACGRVTAMTGDGVNDAPSIKRADIGVGMGITGTDVTKNVADMILGDDNFATIVSAVEEGRRIYGNIRRAIQFLLSSNLSEVLAIAAATFLGFTILEPAHILWINLITDSLPALALGMEALEPKAMKRPPRPAKESVFAHGVVVDIAYQGLFVAILTLAAYLIGHYIESGLWELVNSHDGSTMAFLTLSMAEIAQSFNVRARRESLFQLKAHNRFLYGAAFLAFLLTAAVIYIPFLQNAFGFTSISPLEYGAAMLLAICVIPLVEGVKWLQRRAEKEKRPLGRKG